MSNKNILNNWKKWYPKNIKNNIQDNYFKQDKNNISLLNMYFEKGFKIGIKEGYKLQLKKEEFYFYNEKCIIKNKMKKLLKSFDFAFKNLDTIIVNKLLKMVLKISLKCLNYPIKLNEKEIVKKIKKIISKKILSKNIIFQISKNDKDIFNKYFKKLFYKYNYIIKYNNNINSGECIINLENETIDSTALTKWKELYRLFCNKEDL